MSRFTTRSVPKAAAPTPAHRARSTLASRIPDEMAKTFVVLVVICAVAHAQFPNQRGQSAFGSSAFGKPQNQAQARPGQYQQSAFGSQQKQGQYQQSSFGQQQKQGQYQQSSFGQQAKQGQFQQGSFGQAQQPKSLSPGSCKEKNERYPVSGSCDRYVECLNGTAEEKLCPDGLRFNPNVNFNVYPCQYPIDVPCLERSSLQPAQSTEDCPNQFGYYKLGDARNCSGFRNCVNGVGYDLICPEGLAWNSETYRCDWPDQVADCDAEAFLGFRCPEVPISKELGPPAGYRFYRSDANCQKYFICIEGRPRALTCGGDSAFDELTSTCVSADEVSACPADLRSAAAKAKEAEKQNLALELSLKSKNINKNRRF